MCFHSCQGDGQRGESRFHLNTIDPKDGALDGWEKEDEESRVDVCVAVEEEKVMVGGGGFVPWQELLSLSLGHTRFHQNAHPSFILDANLFRADWWQSFLPFVKSLLTFIKAPKLPAN